MNIVIYSDGSCFSDVGLGGWGVYMIIGEQKTVRFSGYSKCKNSIAMELLAISKAFEYINTFLSHIAQIDVIVYTDCDYIVKLIDKKNRANKNVMPIRDKTSQQNKQTIFDICNNQENFNSTKWISVKSHSGIKGNEIADRLAKAAAKRMISNLDG